MDPGIVDMPQDTKSRKKRLLRIMSLNLMVNIIILKNIIKANFLLKEESNIRLSIT